MRATQRSTRWRGAKGTKNVAPSLLGCQPRLRSRGPRALQAVLAQRDVPMRGERPADDRALIEPALALAGGRQRHRNHCRSLSLDIPWPRQSRHSVGHAISGRGPPGVLECVHDAHRRTHLVPADATCCPDVGRQRGAPAALVRVPRVPAPVAPRVRQRSEARPASPADHAVLGRAHWEVAARAAARQDEIEKRRADRAERTHYGTAPPASVAVSAARIASRGAGTPSQRSNERAPCSSSIGRPSLARSPRARAARTSGVSVGP